MTDEDHSQDLQDLITEHREEASRWKRAHDIACQNIADLHTHNSKITDAIAQALLLIDQLLTEMRLANVTPSAGVIFTKAEFDRRMKVLLRQDK